MAQVELIEFETASRARAELMRMYGREGVLEIELIGNNKVLRVTTEDEGWDGAGEPEAASAAPATAEEPETVQEASKAAEPAAVAQAEVPGGHGTVADTVQDSPLAQDVVPEPISQEKATDPETVAVVTDPATEDEDLLGAPVVGPNTSRDELRVLNEKHNLGVNIPTAGPLQPVRDRVAAALAEKE